MDVLCDQRHLPHSAGVDAQQRGAGSPCGVRREDVGERHHLPHSGRLHDAHQGQPAQQLGHRVLPGCLPGHADDPKRRGYHHVRRHRQVTP